MSDWSEFGRALIGRWPQARWDEQVLVAYVAEAEAEGLRPGEATEAVRDHAGPFPPSIGDLEVLVMAVRARKRAVVVYCGSCDDGWIVEGRTARPCDCRSDAIRAAGGRPREVGEGRPPRRELEPGPRRADDADLPF